MVSCGTYEKAVKVDSTTNYFPARKNKQVNVTIDNPFENKLNKPTLLVVPDADYFKEMGDNLNFFDTVMTLQNFNMAIEKKEFISNSSNVKTLFVRYFSIYSLESIELKKINKRWYTGLKLYDHQNKKILFKNEVKLNLMWDGWTDQGTMFPLYNSLLDYLRKQ